MSSLSKIKIPFIIFIFLALFVIQSCAVIPKNFTVKEPQYDIKTEEFSLKFEELNKQLPVRISYPVGKTRFPVIVFSHGNGSKGDMYKGFTDYWASHGYVVIQPTHMDSTSLGFKTKRDNMREMYQQILQVTDTRRQDMSFIVDSLDLIETIVPDLKDKLDRTKLVAAGHSMGAATAMIVAGMTLLNPMDGYAETSDETRFKVLLMISDPGTMTLMPKEPWKGVRVPTLISTGTKDFSDVGSDRIKAPFKYKIPDSLTRSLSPHHYVLIEGADHYLGGLICRTDVPGPPQHEALRIAAATSTTFLDAYVKNDLNAWRSMRFGDLNAATKGKATLTLK
jgi:dienelactone hydrolase|tara:strand:+ start:620 stop:1630 length:1011 start_codon:yes stop_codon:yes gene_type:complete